jgi:Skp family chaperone for outer membrane proteins
MYYSQKNHLFVVSFIASLMSVPAFAQAPKPASIGVVDKDKVVNAYPKALSAAEDLKKGEDRIRKLLEDSNKQYDEAKTAHKPPVEIEGLKARLQTQIDDEVKRLQSKAQTLEGSLEKDIDNAIRAEAASHKVDAVFMKQAVFFGGVDLTDGVMKRLATAGKTSSR